MPIAPKGRSWDRCDCHHGASNSTHSLAVILLANQLMRCWMMNPARPSSEPWGPVPDLWLLLVGSARSKVLHGCFPSDLREQWSLLDSGDGQALTGPIGGLVKYVTKPGWCPQFQHIVLLRFGAIKTNILECLIVAAGPSLFSAITSNSP